MDKHARDILYIPNDAIDVISGIISGRVCTFAKFAVVVSVSVTGSDAMSNILCPMNNIGSYLLISNTSKHVKVNVNNFL